MEDVKKTTEHDLYLAEDDDSLHIASKCWERVMDAAAKTGYREGIQNGADSVLQEGFEIGFKDGFETAFTLGRYKSLATSLPSTVKHPADVTTVLDKTRRGACWVCSMESQNKTSNENIQFSEILSNQRTHSAAVINRLKEYFEPILNKPGSKTNLTL
ncbi:protein YAE1 homolog [Nylanderia fulva]|uniref:protein YAE1 homolog n=1 Tax=Nylanderia fulva TaxID=613905 RepID=UPI0010FBBB34|nr:protein YAE1 homolog [Nylanderia fulva]